MVEVPAGTKSQSGGELAETSRFEFETPAPSMQWLSPAHDSLQLQPVFLVAFDQRVEPAAVLEAITLSADGQEQEIRLASAAEIESDELIRSQVGYALEGAWVAFRPAVPLEPDSLVSITVGPDVPSAEGPNTSDASSTVEARTYAPLRIEGQDCIRWSCRPGSALSLWFNNTLDSATLDPADFSITPDLPSATISVYDRSLSIAGPTAGGTTYEVVVPGTLGDVFGQSLGESETVEFPIDEASPRVWIVGGGLVTVDPLGLRQTIPVIARQWDKIRVRLYEVDPSEYESYVTFAYRWRRSRTSELPDVPWPLAAEEIVETGAVDDALTEVPIDLSGVLGGEPGHLVMLVDGAVRRGETDFHDEAGHASIVWVQDTNIGIDLITDYRDVAVWTTDLRTGSPLAGVEVGFGGINATLATDDDGIGRTSLSSHKIEWIVGSLGTDQVLYDLDNSSLRLLLGFGLLGSAGFMLGGGRGLRSWRSW